MPLRDRIKPLSSHYPSSEVLGRMPLLEPPPRRAGQPVYRANHRRNPGPEPGQDPGTTSSSNKRPVVCRGWSGAPSGGLVAIAGSPAELGAVGPQARGSVVSGSLLPSPLTDWGAWWQ
jgi:hypothetical protein